MHLKDVIEQAGYVPERHPLPKDPRGCIMLCVEKDDVFRAAIKVVRAAEDELGDLLPCLGKAVVLPSRGKGEYVAFIDQPWAVE